MSKYILKYINAIESTYLWVRNHVRTFLDKEMKNRHWRHVHISIALVHIQSKFANKVLQELKMSTPHGFLKDEKLYKAKH